MWQVFKRLRDPRSISLRHDAMPDVDGRDQAMSVAAMENQEGQEQEDVQQNKRIYELIREVGYIE